MTDDEMPPDPFPPAAARPLIAADGSVVVGVEAVPLNLDAPDSGVWCDTCLLPSAFAYRFRILANGVPLDRVSLTLNACRDCGATWRT